MGEPKTDQVPGEYLPRVGDLIAGRYRLDRRLGQGGMGTVFAAEDLRIGRSCAVKVIRFDLCRDRELRRRFEHEARTTARLHAENVVAVTDLGEHAGLPFLVMELLVGEDLRALLEREGRLPLPRALDIVVQACRGLEGVHARGVVHRDLKPKNLFIARHANGRDLIKVLDFGLAKNPTQPISGVSTEVGTLLGTFQYMPPEQVRGEAVDARSDIYALGAVLYEALAGRAPFEAAEPHVLMHRIMYERPRALRELRPELPAALYDLVERALHPRAQERIASVRELGTALSAIGSGMKVDADAETGRAAASTPRGTTEGPLARTPSVPPSRILWLAVAGLLALIGIAMLSRASQREPRASAPPRPAPAQAAGARARPLDVAKPLTSTPSRSDSASEEHQEPTPQAPLVRTRPAPDSQATTKSSAPPPASARPRRTASAEFDRNNPYD